MNEKVGDLLEFTVRGEVPDVVTAIVQIVAAVTDGTQRSGTGRRSRQGN